MIATNNLQPSTLAPCEELAIANLHARARAIAASEPNRRFHALMWAARELQERLMVFLHDTKADAGKKILAAAGLDDPEDMSRYGSKVFEEARERSQSLVCDLDEFIAFAGNDLPEPVEPAELASAKGGEPCASHG